MAIPIGVSFSSTAVMASTVNFTRYDNTYACTGWSIDRGRSYELDRTGTGTASVHFVDLTGAFDPTGTPVVDVMNHAAIAIQNPVSGATSTLFRGFVSSVEWEPYTDELKANVRVDLVDALAVFAAMELPLVALSGSTVSVVSGNLSFPALPYTDAVQRRIGDGTHYGGILSDVGWPTALRSIFTGNVKILGGGTDGATIYPPRTSVLTVMQDAADAEFPGVANLYVSKDGKLTFHGRLARFNYTDPTYGINVWYAGDQSACSGSTVRVPVSPPIVASRDDSHLYTSFLALPAGVADGDIAGQYQTSSAGTAAYGLRTWSAENLLTGGGTANTALQETALFSTYYKNNYSTVRTRVDQLTVRPQSPTGPYGTQTWNLMAGVEISDVVSLTTSHVGSHGFSGATFYVEGVHYEAKPMNATYNEITLTLDVSPAGYYSSNPF